MQKKIIRTAFTITSLASATGGVYAYLHPEILPEEIRQQLKNYNLFNEPNVNKSSVTVVETPKKIDTEICLINNIKQPINDDSLIPKLESKSKPLLEKPKNLNKITIIQPVDVNKTLEDLTTHDTKNLEIESREISEFETEILSALKDAQDKVKIASEAKYKTMQAINNHAQAIKQAVDDGKGHNWTNVNKALEKLDSLSKIDVIEESNSRNSIDKLKEIILNARKLPKITKHHLLIMADESANKLTKQLDELNYLEEKKRSERRILHKYKDLIEKSRQHFQQELKSVVPDVDIHSDKQSLTTDELNALLAHAYMRVDQFRRELIEQQVREEQHIAQAIEDQQKADAEIAKIQLEMELRRVQESVTSNVEKKIQEERKEWEKELEARLQRASLAHVEHLENVLRTQKQLHDIENSKLVEEAIEKERFKHTKDVKIAMAKLQGIEHALQSRVAMDVENRRAKQFWLACQNLVESIVYGNKAGNTFDERKKPLSHELNVIKEACENDTFVQSIIDLFPINSKENGVFTEQDLRNRFNKVYKLGWRTAKIDENGGGLLKYFLSFVQSIFMLNISRSYLLDDKIDINNIDPYEVLSRSKYFVEKNDFASAIRLLQLLKGQPASLARDWILDARNYLETQFLAQLLIAHATVTSIRTVY